ncbi:unnamed protein product [Notodromas monacha]|uniref:Uncharacterized protein n=1 Tax=Notodromas monacha TaxID=399045 RepID=A0A7R9BND7_9CRUS|nr:unnamed protein product [Notodromas monacha]CAG0917610.1 unnamed protein product [Notodromas monacha]
MWVALLVLTASGSGILAVVFHVKRGESARQSCSQEDVGIKMPCSIEKNPFCLTVASKVCIGTWQLGSCDKKSFWCWQKSCAGDPTSKQGLFLDPVNTPSTIPGCIVRHNVSSDPVNKILIQKAIFCLCDSDGCNNDITDLTGRHQPYYGLLNGAAILQQNLRCEMNFIFVK